MADGAEVLPWPPPTQAPRLTTYAEMIFSRGSGGRPTVSCVWWDSRSVQAYSFRGMGEGERERRRSGNSKGEGYSHKIITVNLDKMYGTCCHLLDKRIPRPQAEQARQGCIPVTFVCPIGGPGLALQALGVGIECPATAANTLAPLICYERMGCCESCQSNVRS